ncbi:Type IV secretion system protein [Vibrio crassostreae]|nr:Type IV secretion system protein [Vibrio crassostreae]
MILTKKIKTTFALLLVLALSGCSEEYTDKSCINSMSELMNADGTPDYSKVTGEPCKSLDIAVLKHRTRNSTKVYENYYSKSDFLKDEEQISFNNKVDQSNNEIGLFLDSIKSVYQNKIFKVSLFIFMIGLFLITKTVKERKPDEQDDTLAYFILVLMVSALLYFTTKTEETTLPVTKTSIHLNNKFSKLSMLRLYEGVTEPADILSNKSKNEALIDIADYMKINVCNSNSQRFHIENKQYAFNPFSDQKEMAEFYQLKNEPFIIDVDEKINGQKIGYSLSSDGFLEKIEVANCGQVLFSTRNINGDTLDLMETLKFRTLLDNAIKTKDFETNLIKLKSEFDKATGGGVSTNDQFVELLVLFSTEYKKGLLWGSILIEDAIEESDKNNLVKNYAIKTFNYFEPKITTDYSNLYEIQSYADEVYDNIIETQCLKDGSLVNDTMKQIESFNTVNGDIDQFDCVSFTEDTIYPATERAYVYHDNRILVDDKIKTIQEDTFPIVDSATIELVKQYDLVNNAFIKQLNEVSNFNTDLAYYYNRGGHAQTKFSSYLYNNKGKYVKTLAEMVDVSVMDFSKSLPRFNVDDEPLINTDVFTVNAFLKNLTAQIDKQTSDVSTNLTNSMLEYRMDNSNFRYEDVLSGDTEAMGDALTNYLENSSQSFSAIRKMVCNGDPRLCVKKLKEMNGEEWRIIANSLRENGAKAIIVGQTANLTFSATTGLLKFSKRKGDTKQAIFGNRSKVAAMSTLSSSLKVAGETIALIGIIAMILGNIMLAVFEIPDFVISFFAQSQIIYLDFLPLFIITTCTAVMLCKYNVGGYKSGLTLLLQMMIFAPVMSVVMPLLAHVIIHFTNLVLKSIPLISGMMLSDSSSVLEQIAYSILAIIGVLFVVGFGLMLGSKYLIKSFKKITENNFFSGSFDASIQGVSKFQGAAVAAGGAVIGKKAVSKVAKKATKKIIRNPIK